MQRVAATFDDAIEACLRETVGAVLVADAALLPRARRAVDLATSRPRRAPPLPVRPPPPLPRVASRGAQIAEKRKADAEA